MRNFKIQTVKCIDRDSWVKEIIDSDGELVCELALNTAEKPQASKYEALIAAAPEMLEALEHLLFEMPKNEDGTFDQKTKVIHSQDAFRKLNAAIRKAKGET